MESREDHQQEPDKLSLLMQNIMVDVKDLIDQRNVADAYLQLGQRQYRSGDFAGAIEAYQHALKLDESNIFVYYLLGYAYTQSGMLTEAEQYTQKLLAIEPDFAPALAVLGYIYRRQSEKMEPGIERTTCLNRAEHYLVHALQLWPKLVDQDGESWWGSLGGLYRRTGRVDEAVFAYSQAAKVVPNSSYAYGNLALLYIQQQNLSKMLETYEQVEKLTEMEIQADIGNYWAYSDLIVARLARGKIKEAELILDKFLELAPHDSPYVIEVVIETLHRLADAMPFETSGPIRRVADYLNEWRSNSTAQP